MRFRLIYIILLCCIGPGMIGQEYDKKDFDLFRTKNGLSNNDVWAVTQDKYGYMWIATRRGLNRFDGSRFQQFHSDTSAESLPSDWIHSLRWLNDEELGALTTSGLHIINIRTFAEHNLIIPPDTLQQIARLNIVSDVIADNNGNIFLTTATGFYQFNHEHLVFRHDHFSREEVKTLGRPFAWGMALANKQTLLLSTSEGLYIYNIEKKDLHALGDNDDPFFHLIAAPKTTFNFLHRDKNSFSVLIPAKKELAIFDVRNKIKQIIHTPVSEFGSESTLLRINDSLMILGGNFGFYKVSLDNRSKTWSLDPKRFFENDLCTSLFLDKNDHLWICSYGGLFREKKFVTKIETFPLQKGTEKLDKIIFALAVAQNKIFVGTSLNGLYVLTRDSLTEIKHLMWQKGRGMNTIRQIVKMNDDSLILGANGNIVNTHNLKAKGIDLIPDSPLQKMANCLYIDSRRQVYCTKVSNDTVFILKPGEKNFSGIKVAELNNIQPKQIAEDPEGNIWFGGEGLARWNSKTKKVDLVLDSFPAFKIPSKSVRTKIVFDKKQNIYFGVTGNGLIIYDWSKKTFSHVTTLEGLPDNDIWDLYLHDDGIIWIATEEGLASLDLNTKQVAVFGTADGMPNDPNICHTLYYDTAHRQLYASFSQTIVRFDPSKLRKIKTPPGFFIESMDIGRNNSIYHPGDVISVSYKNRNIALHLAAINFEDPSQQQFAYRIVKKGNEPWLETGQQHSIFFNNLSLGKNNLQVKTFVRNQSWPEQIKEIIINIRPPFWRTTWFLLLAVGLLVFILYLFYWLRIRQVRQKADLDKAMAQTEMKALHAQMNPHFIFNCLNSIREMILNNENKQASHYLNKFAQLIRITLNQSSKPFVSLENTIDYLQRYIEMEKIRTSNFTHSLEIDEDLTPGDIVLPPMLIQPFIENAIWHGVASPDQPLKIDIRFKKEQQQLLCIIDDNGIGIETSLKKKETQLGNDPVGIDNIKQRIRVLNEKYNMQSTIIIEDKSSLVPKNGTGTIVKLRLPIKKIDV